MPPRRSKPAVTMSLSEPSRLRVPKSRLEQQLAERIQLGEKLATTPVQTVDALNELRDKYYSWNEYNGTLIKRAFTSDEEYKEYAGIGFGLLTENPDELYKYLLGDLKRSVRRLESLTDRLQLYDNPSTTTDEISTTPAASMAAEPSIFLVHGREEGAKHAVARFVQIITGLEPIVLAEQPNLGQTLIEKFEKHASQVSYAIVLLTGDDEGRLRNTRPLKRRARQNVILELGWFAAKLGRQRVAMLYQTGVEIPGDMVGVLYAELDPSEGWKIKLAREMKAAGLPVDMNKVF